MAANRRVIINSDPALDLGEFARRFKPALQSTLSVPLTKNKDLIGVSALYKSAQFSDEERSLAEQIANILAMRVTSYRRHGHVRMMLRQFRRGSEMERRWRPFRLWSTSRF